MENKINDSEKLDKKDIDYSLYSSEPEKLFSLAQEQINKSDFTQGLEILNQSINLAIKKYGGEDKIQLAQYYNKYADCLLQKISLSSNIDIIVKESKDENNKDLLDIYTVYEYLYKSNEILQNYLDEFNDKNPSELTKEIISYYLQLSDNYNLLASYEKEMLNFKKAFDFYNLSITYAKKYDNKFSRNLAGLYFEQAQILLYDPFNCLLFLYKAKVIMEYHLQNEINKLNLDIKLYIDENDLDLKKISYEEEKIFKNKNIIETNQELIKAKEKNSNIHELIDIIDDVNNKINNVILELKEYDNFMKQRQSKQKSDENNINNSEENNVEDLINNMNNIRLINIKRSEPSNNDDDVKIVEEDFSKEKNMEF